jgi:tRNA(Ile)-lysidine synthase
MPPKALRRPPAVARVLGKITATARRTEMFLPGELVVVACSGGPDSLCLLHSMVRLRRLLRVKVACFHFDHALREGSEADADYVRRRADGLEVPFVLRRATSKPGKGESVEAWARTVRYEALREVVEELGGGVAAVGHTMDDQAETILMALLFGGGLRGLGGMAEIDRPIVRPLLDVTRDETEAFCRSLGLRPRRDPMNEDPARTRVAIRRLVPMLEEQVGRGIRAAVVRTGRQLREDATFLEVLIAADAAGLECSEVSRPVDRWGVGRHADGGVELSIDRLERLSLPMRTRLLRRVLYDLGVRVERAHVDAVLDLLEGRPGRRVHLPGGLLAVRTREYVRLARPSPAS